MDTDHDVVTREIQIVTDAITQALRYPSQQMFCLRAITAVIPTIYLEKGYRRMDKLLRTEDHDFLNTITSFVTTQRSEAESRTLIEQLSRCNCDRTNSSIESFHHSTWYGTEANGLFVALENHIFRILTGIISSLPKDRLDKLSSGPQSRRWPTKVSDLMPNGESATVDAFISHGMTGGLTHSLTTLSLYYQYIPSTLEYAIGRGDCYSVVSFNLDIAIGYFERSSVEDYSGKVFTEYVGRIKSTHNYVSNINNVFTSGQLGTNHLNQLKHVMEVNARSTYEKVVRLLDILASTPFPSLEPECFHITRGLAVTLWSHIPSSIIRSSRLVPHPMIFGSDDDAESKPYFFLHGIIQYYLERKDCSNPDCSASQRDEKRAFSFCSGCRCMKYCSRECQKICWTLAYAPHKKICKALGPLGQMAADAEKKANKTNRVDSSLKRQIFKDKARVGGVNKDQAQFIYEEMRKVFEKDGKKTRTRIEVVR